MLSWSLCIATYNRRDVLARSLRLAVAQSRRPAEIIVVDASPDWRESQKVLTREIASAAPDIRWEYVQAERRSSAAQRNQAIELATSDILFLFDDDSLMHPTCAEEIMRVYEADSRALVQAVGAIMDDRIPDAPEDASTKASSVTRHQVGLAKRFLAFGRRFFSVEYDRFLAFGRRFLLESGEELWVPYDADYPEREIPAEVRGLNIIRTRLIGGARMTFRRNAIAAVRFADLLEALATWEDFDATYRVSRLGALVLALDARLHHIGAPVRGKGLSRCLLSKLCVLNNIALHTLHSTDQQRSARRLARVFARHVLIGLAADVYRGRWALPTFRGYLFGLSKINEIINISKDKINDYYPRYQRELIGAIPGGLTYD